MAIKLNQVVLNKLKENKKENSKVDLALYDGIEYDFDYLQDEVSRLSYSTEEWYDEKFAKFHLFTTLSMLNIFRSSILCLVCIFWTL